MTVSTTEALIGFDVRSGLLSPDPSWDEKRRQTFLLREVEKPLSVDTAVWPSVMPKSSEWHGTNGLLWDDLQHLREEAARLVRLPHTVIAVTWVSDRGFTGSDRLTAGHSSPAERDPSWALLGYDVADASLTSGLTNCGYTQLERASLRAALEPDLSARHLFESVEHAMAFRAVCDMRVREHAPFMVFGLWKISNAGTEAAR